MNMARLHEVPDTIEIRGAVEGLAARLAARRGVTPAQLQPLQACLGAIDRLLGQGAIDAGFFSDRVEFCRHARRRRHGHESNVTLGCRALETICQMARSPVG